MERNDELGRLIPQIPDTYVSTPELCNYCCCGNTECDLYKKNCIAFEQLERELRIAAQIGKALLSRHKQFMHDAEQERLEMVMKNGKLESDKKVIEEQNEKTQKTNRWLFDQLEELNRSVAQSETHIKALESTLDSTRFEFKRLQTLAARTQHLESQLVALEQEQGILQDTIWTTHELKQKAIQRWKTAEKRLIDLQEQLELIHLETREERERHAQVLTRLKKQESSDRENNLTDESLVANTNGSSCNADSIVSHFVEGILQDNASLQTGISELQEMLLCSNEEAQMLREQLKEHQIQDNEFVLKKQASSLEAELSMKDSAQAPVISQTLHIHHHYRVPQRRRDTYKYKRKRCTVKDNSLYTSERNLKSKNRGTSKKLLTLQENVTAPKSSTQNKPWFEHRSQVSDVTSSAPSTPRSFNTRNTLFDRGYDFDSSSLTSPGSSVDHNSSILNPHKISTTVCGRDIQPIFESQKEVDQDEKTDRVSKRSGFKLLQLPFENVSIPRESFRKNYHSSHKPILSISSIDIHALKFNPVQSSNSTTGNLHCPPYRLESVAMINSKNTIASSYVMARPTLTFQGQADTSKHLSNVLARNIDIHSVHGSGSRTKISQWIREHLGRSPSKVTERLISYRTQNLTQRKISRRASASHKANIVKSTTCKTVSRPRGINQKGPVPGFSKKTQRLPCQINPVSVDYNALDEVLTDNLGSLRIQE